MQNWVQMLERSCNTSRILKEKKKPEVDMLKISHWITNAIYSCRAKRKLCLLFKRNFKDNKVNNITRFVSFPQSKENQQGLLVPCCTYKKFKNSHSVLTTNKQLNSMKSPQLFLDRSEDQEHKLAQSYLWEEKEQAINFLSGLRNYPLNKIQSHGCLISHTSHFHSEQIIPACLPCEGLVTGKGEPLHAHCHGSIVKGTEQLAPSLY